MDLTIRNFLWPKITPRSELLGLKPICPLKICSLLVKNVHFWFQKWIFTKILKDSFDDNDWKRSVITYFLHMLKQFLIAWTIDYKIGVSWFFSWGINPFFKSVEMNKGAISMMRISLGEQNWRGNITLHANSKPCVIELEYCDISVLNKPSKSFWMLKNTVFS